MARTAVWLALLLCCALASGCGGRISSSFSLSLQDVDHALDAFAQGVQHTPSVLDIARSPDDSRLLPATESRIISMNSLVTLLQPSTVTMSKGDDDTVRIRSASSGTFHRGEMPPGVLLGGYRLIQLFAEPEGSPSCPVPLGAWSSKPFAGDQE